jgi:hypothetical protein
MAVAGSLVTIVTNPVLLIAARMQEWIDFRAEGLQGFVADFFRGKLPDTWLCPETQLFAVPLGQSLLPEKIDELRSPSMRLPLHGGGRRFKRWLECP